MRAQFITYCGKLTWKIKVLTKWKCCHVNCDTNVRPTLSKLTSNFNVISFKTSKQVAYGTWLMDSKLQEGKLNVQE